MHKISDTSNEDELVPSVFSLAQNYPNPFNPTTQISFNSPAAGHVELKVYNMLGREVLELISGQRTAGSHTIRFEAANLASGVYLYELRFNGAVLSNKMILLK